MSKCLNCRKELYNLKRKYCSMKCKDVIFDAEYFRSKSKEQYEVNKQEKLLKMKEYNRINIVKINKYKKEYKRNREQKDIQFKLINRLRTRFNNALKNNQKVGSAVKDLGCSIDEFKCYIESKWQPGMTWNNWSKTGWEIDHIVPLCKFDLANIEEFKKACHYSNLQPLWKSEHIIKTQIDIREIKCL